jgi:hypothetical protein
MKVFIYYNLHKKCWSVKALEGPNKGRVVQHCKVAALAFCEYKVSEKGRQRVLKDKCKNVHAGIVGYLRSTSDHVSNVLPDSVSLLDMTRVTYNPYRYDSFVDRETKTPIYNSRSCIMADGEVFAL